MSAGEGRRPEIAERVPDHVTHYCGLLAEQLRLAGLPKDRVRTVVHDVLAHVRATGEDPVEAFGQPADYAAQWGPPPSVGAVLVRMLGAGLGFVGIGVSIRATISGGPWTALVPLGVGDLVNLAVLALVGGVLPWTVGLWLGRRRARTVGRGHRWSEGVVQVASGFLAVGALMVLGNRLLPPAEQVLFSVPRWLLLAVGLAACTLLLVVRSPEGRSLPRPPTGGRR